MTNNNKYINIDNPKLYKKKWLLFNNSLLQPIKLNDCDESIYGHCLKNLTLNECINKCKNFLRCIDRVNNLFYQFLCHCHFIKFVFFLLVLKYYLATLFNISPIVIRWISLSNPITNFLVIVYIFEDFRYFWIIHKIWLRYSCNQV